MATPAPYPYNTLKGPLNAIQRAAVLAYIRQFFSQSVGGTAPSGGLTSPNWTDFTSYSDQSVINEYNSIVGNTPTPPGADPGAVTPGVGPVPGILNPLAGIVDTAHFLGLLTKQSTWIRVAEFAIGGLLLAIGANAALKQVTTQSKNPISASTKQVGGLTKKQAAQVGRATFLSPNPASKAKAVKTVANAKRS